MFLLSHRNRSPHKSQGRKPQLELLEGRVLLSVYFEDFNSGAGGWYVGNSVWMSTGGVGNSGFLQGTRAGLSPTFYPVSGRALTYATGNLEAIYGNLIQVSYDARIFAGADTPPWQTFIAQDSSGVDTYWFKQLAPASSVPELQQGWTHFSFTINTDWTDAQAESNGWALLSASDLGSLSWSDVLHNLYQQEVFYHVNSSTGATVVTGIDNVQMESVLPDLAATSLTWNTAQGGVDFTYQVSGSALPQDTTAALYWASGTTADTILEPAATPIPIPSTTPVGVPQTVHVAPHDLPGGPPPDAKYLLLELNPDKTVHESDEANDTNNLRSIPIPEPDLVATSLTWNTAQGGVDFGYQVNDAALPQDTTAALYWASGTTQDTILEPASDPDPHPQHDPSGCTPDSPRRPPGLSRRPRARRQVPAARRQPRQRGSRVR